jgi:hypothetical protein
VKLDEVALNWMSAFEPLAVVMTVSDSVAVDETDAPLVRYGLGASSAIAEAALPLLVGPIVEDNVVETE